MSERVFVVDIEPRDTSRWDVWISEEPYRGIDTDAALPGERQKIGSGWTSRRLIGQAKSEWSARRIGNAALRTAQRRAAANEAEQKSHQRFLADNKPIRLTIPTPRHANDEMTTEEIS